MLRFLLNPVRSSIEAVGRVLARLGLIEAGRARRVSNLAWPRIVTGLARMSKSTADVAMVGTALGASAIAGVGFAVPFWALAFMLGLFAFALPAAYLGATTSLGIAGLYLALLLETGVPAAVTYFRFQSERWKCINRAYRPTAG